ncbi:hypothetical protein EYF80_018965 [Liparis tanakae]|uniref:Uncharacterized protein n=1 Tax=Liparis tanakae TaxID=230148 RepID=A0A4Z2HZ33_9TELE|nr:hypothetical protein EYF80_018965 [Liparis tanakae]
MKTGEEKEEIRLEDYHFVYTTLHFGRATLLPRTQLSCSWTHSAVLCKSVARPAVGGGLGLL